MINKSNKVIPSSCRIVDAFFTHMSIIGNFNENGDYESKHMDKEAFVTALFHVGDPSNGGKIKYYTGLNRKSFGYLAKEISCQHGRLNIGRFDKTIHCGESWSGICGCINFKLKKKVTENFLRYGNKYYKQFECNNSPSVPFFHDSYDHD